MLKICPTMCPLLLLCVYCWPRKKTARYEWEAWKCLWCWLPIVLLWSYMLIVEPEKRCWGVKEGGIVFGKNTHWLLGDHPCKLFFSPPTPITSENKRISKEWAQSCWNNAGHHYNVFFPHPNPSSTSAEKERLTFRRVGQNRLNTCDHCTMLFSQPTFLASSEKICT